MISDSELMVKQMRGEYRVKNGLSGSSRPGRPARARVGAVRYTEVRREQNKLADQLVNQALDAAGRAGPRTPRPRLYGGPRGCSSVG